MKNILNKSVDILEKGNSLLYPTDTVWGIGCDATNELAVSKIYAIKQREESKSLIVLVSSVEMLQKYVDDVSNKLIDFINQQTRPTTIIYKNPENLAINTIAKDGTIAIRIVTSGFVHDLIQDFGKPIVSTSANISGEVTPSEFKAISKDILNSVDFVVNLPLESNHSKPSIIVKFVDDKIEVLRA